MPDLLLTIVTFAINRYVNKVEKLSLSALGLFVELQIHLI